MASHDRSFLKAVDEVLDSGVELSNIRFIYNPSATTASIIVNAEGPKVDVTWLSEGNLELERGAEAESLGSIVRTVAGLNSWAH